MKKLLLASLFLASSLYGQGVVKSTEALNITYLVDWTKLVTANKTSLKTNLLSKCTSHWQPSGKFWSLANSTRCVAIQGTWGDNELRIDASTTRILITIPAETKYTDIAQALITAGKATYINTLYLRRYINGTFDSFEYPSLNDVYPLRKLNTDWYIYKDDVSFEAKRDK